MNKDSEKILIKFLNKNIRRFYQISQQFLNSEQWTHVNTIQNIIP